MSFIIDDSKGSAQLNFKGGINENCKLDSVEFNPAYVNKKDSELPEEQQVKKAALIFHFSNNVAAGGDKRILSWGTYAPDTFNATAFKIFQQKFKHIYEVYTGKKYPVFTADTLADIYKHIADTFNGNTTGEDGNIISKPIYRDVNGTPIAVNIKATYDKSGKSTGINSYPNFIEKYTKPGVTTLEKKQGDLYEPPSRPSGLAIGGDGEANGGAEDDLPF